MGQRLKNHKEKLINILNRMKTKHTNLWDVAKVVLRKKCTALNAYIKKGLKSIT